ncbi:copper homeostasis membrane protein CopD [Kalamiella sp. sgz302252]|uniref:copper homeostasis membrane protein CopD n=1 Tax=Pantoea sp. sgz302252 TaxID=3341827 RepID=UPI0036D32F93
MSLGCFYVLCRWLHFAALMTLTGGAAFTALLAPARFRPQLVQRLDKMLAAAALLSLLTALLLLAAQTGLMADGWNDIVKAPVWQAVLQTRFGQVWQWQLAMALPGVVALLFRGRARQSLLLLSGTGQLVGLAFVGHAAMLDGIAGWLQRANQIVHLLSAAFWAGGLIPVAILMRDMSRFPASYDAVRTLMRFSRYGHLAVALVIFSGLVNAFILLPAWPPTFGRYTQLLLVKTLLVALMCCLALFNRYWLVPRFQSSGVSARHIFMLTTLAEVLLAALVLGLVSFFATLEPA